MKRLIMLIVFVALGAATLSCEDTNYNEVEQAVLDNKNPNTTDGDDEIKDRPGGN